MTYRTCVVRFLIAFFIFIAFNFITWKLFTEKLLTTNYGTGGDLARLGYIVDSKQPRRAFVDLPKQHISLDQLDGQKVDMLVIGDSFSNGGGEGKNSYYQDYIATYNNFTVLNLFIYKQGPIETVMYLVNSGLLDVINPRYVLIQSVERFSVGRFSGEINFKVTEDPQILRDFYTKKYDPFNYLPSISFLNDGNVKYIYYRLRYLFSDDPTKIVIRKKLKKPLFDVKDNDRLLFYFEDTKNIGKSNQKTISELNNNMNKLADLLQKRNIKLYFMPSVDKYNLYSEFIVNNPYPASVFFEELRPLDKHYEFIDTKKILLEAVRRGEKDIYYADDTHWSWKAAEHIFKDLKFGADK